MVHVKPLLTTFRVLHALIKLDTGMLYRGAGAMSATGSAAPNYYYLLLLETLHKYNSN